ncbi:ANTAR domain-containing response regulator [Pectinatus haikarae]|uniref:Response regulator NasT n=1 Tax=Pectinatus haikarae TaxID=349096 RepID=A0ABT9Y5W3_9FIRM|nr:response regulator [Pectinatus haikarae]MDQ0202587.1 response regulator NasT [Pectinatus haikarae]
MKSLSILVAEDEVMIRTDIEEALEDSGHVICGSCGDGKTAVDLARQFQPQLAVMDIAMPGIDGLEAASAMHSMGIPVVIVTANSQAGFLQRAENVHVYGYIIKPISEQNLLATVQIAYARWQEFVKTISELKQTRQILQDQKTIGRARSIIQDRFGISAQEAHRRLVQMAMKKQMTLAVAAEKVITQAK